MESDHSVDTITAIATPPGRGGVGIIRISGPLALTIASQICHKSFISRQISFSHFYDSTKQIIDSGIVLYFAAPNSFTGEEVVELQGHGGPIVMDLLLKAVLGYGARMANPGEFSLRAYLNNKIDLTQAEAIADLINANSVVQARSAQLSLQGTFSKLINEFIDSLIRLRMFVEAAIDFPDEEINFLSDGRIADKLVKLIKQLEMIQKETKVGSLLSEGVKVVIMGRPNAGKSSLLNCLSGKEAAIVTEIAGTTRDILKENIQLDGLILQLIDTAGLRLTQDIIEQEGIKRALAEIQSADVILMVVDGTTTDITNPLELFTEWNTILPEDTPRIVLVNKIDKLSIEATLVKEKNYSVVYISALTEQGMDLFRTHLKETVGYNHLINEPFTARRRHVEALEVAYEHLIKGQRLLLEQSAGELLAEELSISQKALEEITGRFSSDDLLGRIFSEFCIGK
ncbi:MAG: trmE [Francisellaceae bacterium]|nr:trmE [Francisellaceae bacterium]